MSNLQVERPSRSFGTGRKARHARLLTFVMHRSDCIETAELPLIHRRLVCYISTPELHE